ncbi:uncharacterized protein K452DRAFT_305786 [Aplosporella prunicola CBS 121167]|uniref:Nephrocystin 3-like N-terminal domain-containing protein n=1 Tax=Aplosporella prunicola CBS 121167 TaxID=1176127 RepID=A0A6A6BRI1_9PEZI|nr:uncharacterized protein K452DRAFT_305786 [Aplosporella prunicola CBS 121167]KAF2145844.1 hypothetical protein K452DRAFT_305786 [Aplosporella prunicola CBS 121167]
MERRRQENDQWDKLERERQLTKRLAVMSWLRVGDTLIEDEVDKLTRDCLEGSCDWFIEHNKTKWWMNDGTANALLWLCGKPGAGKSVLCSKLIQSMEAKKLNVFYYSCSYLETAAEGPTRLLRSLTAQAVQNNPDLIIYIHDDYIPSHPVASRRPLMGILPNILIDVGSSRLIIDGIDEWDRKEQKLILKDVLQLLSTDASSHTCKVLISSRDVPTVSPVLRKNSKTSVSLSDESRQSAEQASPINPWINYIGLCFIRHGQFNSVAA